MCSIQTPPILTVIIPTTAIEVNSTTAIEGVKRGASDYSGRLAVDEFTTETRRESGGRELWTKELLATDRNG